MVALIVKGGSTLFRRLVMKPGAAGRDQPARRRFALGKRAADAAK